MYFGVPAAFGLAHSLCLSASGWVQPALMNLHMAGIHVHRLALLRGGDLLPDFLPDAIATPPSIVLVDRIPARFGALDRTPGAAFAQDEKNAGEHNFHRQR